LVSVSEAGYEEVFDFCVPEHHNAVVSGFYAHNSGSLEQDADVVMLLYRGEYYFPDDDNLKNKAEVIVAKQRNGPVGTVDLYADMSTTYFGEISDRSEPETRW